MENQVKAVVHNHFDFEVSDAETGAVKQRVRSYNIILDTFFSQLVNRSAKLTYIQIGTGSGTLSETQIGLFSYLGYKQAATVETVKAYPTSYIRKKIVLLPGEYVGSRITEVGFSFSNWNGSLVTHSMLKDSEGNPLAIEKTATDVITIYGTFYLTIGQPVEDNVVLATPETNYIIRCVLEDNNNLYVPSIVAGLYTNFSTANGIEDKPLMAKTNILPSADAVNRKWVFPTTRFDYNEANGHYVSSIGIPTIAVWKLPDSATFPNVLMAGVNVGTGDGTKTVFDCPIPKIVPQSETVRINGVVQERGEDYTIDYENNALGLPEFFTCARKDSFDPLISFVAGHTWLGHSRYPLIYPSNEDYDPVNRYKVPVRIENVYDFRESKPFNTLLMYPHGIECFYDYPPTGSFKIKLEYSLDNLNWVTALITDAFPIDSRYLPGERAMLRFPEISARYIRFSILTAADAVTTDFHFSSDDGGTAMVGYTTPGLTFATAPAVGDIITMDCYVDRPFKNENWVLDFGCSVSFERA